ncbi:MAG: hypothetical protein LBS35_11345 [Synergistaceae bacterium]|jgi:hypothetical protein|nr:hypothetical protein [Synergistaceae bacterium]
MKHRGFALLVVMVMSMIAMIFVGVMFDIVSGAAGAGRVSARLVDKYNILQSEIETARSALKAEMSSSKDALKCGLSEKDTINSLEDLEVLKNGVPFWRVDYREKTRDMTGDVSVRIYDMQYFAASAASDAVAATLPYSVSLGGVSMETGEALEPGSPSSSTGGTVTNAGVYLIRATITFKGGGSNKIDVGVIQNSNPKA